MPIVWTDDLKERVEGLWPTKSAAEIAAQFRADGYDISRSSVVGVLRRMGLNARNKVEDHPSACNANRSKPRAPSLKIVAKTPDSLVDSLFGPTNVRGIAGLEPHHCRNPLNDDMSDPLFCGRVKADGKSFCPICCAQIFLPREERRAAA